MFRNLGWLGDAPGAPFSCSCHCVVQFRMASYVFPRFDQLTSFSVSCKSHSRAWGALDRASVALVSVISHAVSLRPKIAGGSHAFAVRALLCNVILNGNIGGQSLCEPALVASAGNGEEGLWSVIIPTYNRLPILTKCLEALEEQEGYERSGIRGYEVVVVDDGSADGTWEYLQPATQLISGNFLTPISVHTSVESSRVFPHVKFIRQQHGGMIHQPLLCA